MDLIQIFISYFLIHVILSIENRTMIIWSTFIQGFLVFSHLKKIFKYVASS